jgi:hypothetical protein
MPRLSLITSLGVTNMGMKILLALRLAWLAIVVIALLASSFDYQGPLSDPYLTSHYLDLFIRTWLVLEAIYWHAKYKDLKKSGVLA